MLSACNFVCNDESTWLECIANRVGFEQNPKENIVFIVQSIAHVSLVRSIVIKTASADAGISCKEAFRESEASKSVGISE